MAQTYSFGYLQRHPEWQGNPWTGFRGLMRDQFGKELPSLVEMVRANPRAVAEHVLWNFRLVPNGLQVLLFNAAWGERNPDYAPVQTRSRPALVLGLGQAAYIARMARSSLLEVVREDYVRTARAKGVGRRRVIRVHALPNAMLPVITLSGILLGFVLAGSIPVERAFGTPGLGSAMFTAVSERDIFVMQNLVFLYAVVFVALNMAVDILTAWLDPRIRLQ